MPNQSAKKPHPVDLHVGKQLRLRRNMLGMNQDNLGKQVGITFQQIQKYEHGTNRISASRIWEFAQVLQVSEAFFFEGYRDGSGSVANATEMNFDNKESLLLIKAYYTIHDPKIRPKALQLIKALGAV
jgi:transcriptional regulator with XRE-family HTH domain